VLPNLRISKLPKRRTHRTYTAEFKAELVEACQQSEDWRTVVTSALAEAKAGSPQARNWLAQYLVGRPQGKAPKPLTVVANQLNGADPLMNRIAKPLIDREKFPL
jgi:transposase-like protein